MLSTTAKQSNMVLISWKNYRMFCASMSSLTVRKKAWFLVKQSELEMKKKVWGWSYENNFLIGWFQNEGVTLI